MKAPGAQLLDLLAVCAPDVAHLALALREVVLNEEPEAEELLYSVYAQVIVFKLKGSSGGAFCYVAAYARHVNLGFYRGAELPDLRRVLCGTGKKMRHIRFDSLNDLARGHLGIYIREAIEQVRTAPVKGRRRKMGSNFSTVDEYIAAQPLAVQKILDRVRGAIRKALPGADELISYKMPTYVLGSERVLHFAVWKQHYAIYAATAQVVAAFGDELAGYEIDKGTIRFPLSGPVPVKLIGRIAKFRAKEVATRARV